MDNKLPDVRTLDIGQLKAWRLTLVNQLMLTNQQIEAQVYSECRTCEMPEFARGIPDGWGYFKALPDYLLCKNCIATWTRLHGKPPEVFREGDSL